MNNNYKFTTIRELADRITRHPLMEELTLDGIIQYAIDFITIVGLPTTFEEKSVTLTIKNFRAELPCDALEIIQVRNDKTGFSMRSSFDSFATAKHSRYKEVRTEDTFVRRGNILNTSFQTGQITVVYKSIAVDDMGFPLIPDDPLFQLTLELYIKKQYFMILFDLGKISHQALNVTQQEYAFKVGQLRTSYIMPSINEMEGISNFMTELLPNHNRFKHGFRHLGDKEYIKAH